MDKDENRREGSVAKEKKFSSYPNPLLFFVLFFFSRYSLRLENHGFCDRIEP